jgi:hypothetical protein
LHPDQYLSHISNRLLVTAAVAAAAGAAAVVVEAAVHHGVQHRLCGQRNSRQLCFRTAQTSWHSPHYTMTGEEQHSNTFALGMMIGVAQQFHASALSIVIKRRIIFMHL